MTRRLFWTLFLIATLVVAGCGDGRSPTLPSTTDAGADGSGADVPRPNDGGEPPLPPVTASCGGDLDVGHRLHSLGSTGILHPISRRVVTFPDYLTSSLSAMPLLELTVEGGRVSSIPVTGEVPDGRVMAATYQPTLDRFVVLFWTRLPEPHYGLTTVELTATEARFASLELVNAPPSDGYQINDLYALSGTRLAVIRGLDALLHVTIDGTTATFSPEITLSTTNYPETIVFDAPRQRLIGYGLGFDPTRPREDTFLPRVSTLSLEGPGGWVEVTTGGEVPEALTGEAARGVFEPWAAFDDAANQLTVAHQREEEDPFFPEKPIRVAVLYNLDLNTNTWSSASDDSPIGLYTTTYGLVVDPLEHRVVSIAEGHLVSMSLSGAETGQASTQPLENAGGPRRVTAAAALPDGSVVATDPAGLLYVLDTGAVPSWTRLGEAVLPNDLSTQHSLHYNPVDDSLLLFGGTDATSGRTRLHRIDVTGENIVEIEVSDGPSARGNMGSLVHENKLYIAGGWQSGGVADPALGDIWELDLASMRFVQIATLEVRRARIGLTVIGAELWLIGGVGAGEPGTAVGSARVDAMNLDTYAIREVEVTGDWPARRGIWYGGAQLGDSFVAFDIVDDTIDGSEAVLWQLRTDGSGGALWANLGGCFVDAVVANTVGVSVSAGQVWSVGHHVLSIASP